MSRYDLLADHVLDGKVLSRDDARTLLCSPREDWLWVLTASLRVRERYHGRKVKLCLLQNSRSGQCPEDCNYCSQSVISDAKIDHYGLLSKEALVLAAQKAVQSGARRFCMVTSGRGPSDGDIRHLCDVVSTIKSRHPNLEICCSLGLMDVVKARRLKSAGVGWVNHNLNTSERFYPEICKTHTYQDRLETLKAVKEAGLFTCSGGIIGMGETDEDRIDMAFALKEMDIDSIPINFLHPMEGTPLGSGVNLDPIRGLMTLALVRLLNPTKEVRAAGGREFNLKDLQKYAIYPANSIFIEGYLTTPGQQAAEAKRMIEEMGFEVERIAF